MTERKCNSCGVVKNLEEGFYKNRRLSLGYTHRCKECLKAYHRRYVQANHETIRRKLREQSALYRKQFQEFKATLSCEKCGENHPATLDFHHSKGSKKAAVTELVSRGMKAVLREVKKCTVLCANCHRKLHATNCASA